MIDYLSFRLRSLRRTANRGIRNERRVAISLRTPTRKVSEDRKCAWRSSAASAHGLRPPRTGEGRLPRCSRRVPGRNAGAGSSLGRADVAQIAWLRGVGVVHAGTGDRSQHRHLFGGLRHSAAAATLSGCLAPGFAQRGGAAGRQCERLLPEFSRLASAEPRVFGDG